MATEEALSDPQIVSAVLRHLSDMKYRSRRQYGPNQPVELLEFRPTLVPSILVNKLFCDEGTSILWRRYPHLPTLREMPVQRRQYYANKVQHVFAMSPPSGKLEPLDFLKDLAWPNLKSLELEIDVSRHGHCFESMLHAGLEHLEISWIQSANSKFFCERALPSMLNPCTTLKSLRISQDTMLDDDPQNVSVLFGILDENPGIRTIAVKSTNFLEKDVLFIRLSHRAGLEGLEIDLDPGLAMLPLLSGPSPLISPFSSLKHAWIMCYPEVALQLPKHLRSVQELQLDIARIPNQLALDSDHTILDDLIAKLSHCGELRLLKIGVGMMAENFPSSLERPGLAGRGLVHLAASCPKLEDINLTVTEPAAIDGSAISGDDFDAFCKGIPRLRNLNLKLHPAITGSLEQSALLSLGKHCAGLEVLRIKAPLQLPALPVPATMPHIRLDGEPSLLDSSIPTEPLNTNAGAAGSSNQAATSAMSNSVATTPSIPRTSSAGTPLFPHLTHLAISRPRTALADVVDNDVALSSSVVSSSSHPSQSATDIVDPVIEETLVCTWADPLLAHFPRLEILEAWGDWTGQDNESLNYFLPMEEILASTWEFLSGIEQDLWHDEDDAEASGSWQQSWESTEDWEKASLINEFIAEDDTVFGAVSIGKLALYDQEPEGMITPGRTINRDELFDISNLRTQDED